MTGFGRAVFEVNHKKITIEIKSLNSKQIDINTRIPALYREKEIEIRKMAFLKLIRGKVDINIYLENLGDVSNSRINGPVLKSYYQHLSEIIADLGMTSDTSIFQALIRLPDVVKTEFEALDENEWNVIKDNLEKALNDIDVFRAREGEALRADVEKNIKSIVELLSEIEPFEKQRIETLRQRIKENLESLKINNGYDKNRFEQELIFYLEKLDINEEKVRLGNHCNYFLETMELPESTGKKLGFISQEIGREINTIGSKANEANIQRLVVKMKDHLEKVKEQLLNVL